MRIIVEPDYAGMSARAATQVADAIRRNPHLVLGLATGRTPLGMYRCWIDMVREGKLSFAEVTTFNLDEYVGLTPDHPHSFHTFMREALFRHVDIRPERIHIPNGAAADLDEECLRFERQIEEAGGIDLQILGIGLNGHIGFNEPGESFDRLTHVVRLSEDTRLANARDFSRPEEVPTHAVTMGLKSIMNARRILLLAAGREKAEAVVRAVTGPVTERVPASVLQRHSACTFVLDREAASKLPDRVLEGRGR